MTTVVRLDQDAAGRARLDLVTGELSPRVVERGAGFARVALVATVALLLADDDVVVEVEVAPGMRLELVETSGTVAHDMRGGRASWHVSARVGEGAALVWAGLPLVVSRGADVVRRTTIELAESARAMLRETIVLGRTGEVGGDLVTHLDVRRPGGRPVLREDLDLRRPHRHAAGVLGSARCLDQVTLLGVRAELGGVDVLQLAEPGTLVRALTAELHESPLTGMSSYFQMEMLSRSDGETAWKHGLTTILPIGRNTQGNDAGAYATGQTASRRVT